MILFGISLLCAIWFHLAIKQFPHKINQQTYQDMQSLIPLNFSLQQCLANSKLQPKNNYFSWLFFILFPCISILFTSHSSLITLILFILIYLSLLDYEYYLTDSRYVSYILLLSLAHLLFFDSLFIYEKIFCLFFTFLFFAIFIPLTTWIYKKDVFGLGDAILFIAISPLFQLDQMLWLLLCSCLLGILFYLCHWLIKKEKLIKLPFIPFISFSTVSLLWINH
ncbi:hypothetical protein A1D29_05495 [Pasteurellaceae bacterium Orientalotternb1]|nr:hypothetical protein A1D29_05495 [Pasteurellaceae bacterium Orientalotternb1]